MQEWMFLQPLYAMSYFSLFTIKSERQKWYLSLNILIALKAIVTMFRFYQSEITLFYLIVY